MNSIALIILNYNRKDDTIACVEQLLSFNQDYKIIVVDNCSTDGSFEIIKQRFTGKRVDFIQNKENRGYSYGNNIGMKYAIAKYEVDIVGVLNPDVIIPEATVIDTMAVQLMSKKEYGIIGGITLNADLYYNINQACWNIPNQRELILNHCLLTNRKKKCISLKIASKNLAYTECIVGCFYLAKSEVMEEIGFLDENLFLYNEENLLGIKCKQKGYREVIALDQFYIHNHKSRAGEQYISFSDKVLSTKDSFQSRKYLCKEYYSKYLLPLLYCAELLNRLYLVLCYFVNRIR